MRIVNDAEFGVSSARNRHEVHINGVTVHDEPQILFGGVQDSGWGRFGGSAVLDEFNELRWITSRDPRSRIRSDVCGS